MAVKEFSAQQQTVDYSQVVQSASFQQLMRENADLFYLFRCSF